jgi:hexosaminidase
MKKIIILLLSLTAISCGKDYDLYQNVENTKEDYPVIPKPLDLQIQNGRFLVDENTYVSAPEELKNEADYLVQMLSTSTGDTVPLKQDQEEERGIFLKLVDSIQNEEGYILNVSDNSIEILGATPAGIFYGLQSLRQLMPAETETEPVGELTIPAVKIVDEPRYTYRGMHLDVARHMFPVDFIKTYIDLLALHKMNRFHWHLTEDQGWRIEIKKYPKLTEIGSVRKETMVGKNFDPYLGDGKEYGGFYTQEEVKDIVAYAQKKHITIIPEIEMPGHSRAALAAYPELGNNTGPYEVATTWGVFEEIYAPKEETFKFLENVLIEVMDLFPSEYIHIGGDEAPKDEWKKSAQAQEVIKREGLKNEHELQSYFIKRIEKYLNAHGRQIIGWDEILEGGLAPNSTVMSWRGTKGGIAAAGQGHDVVMTPGSHLYFDHYQAAPENEPMAFGGFTTVKKVYSFEPTPEVLTEEQKKHILGAQANVWTEYIKTSDQVEYMVLPRMSALAEVVWTPAEDRDWEDFKIRFASLAKRFDQLELKYAPHIFEEE